jgi:3-oxoacyl-[acyl-carrier-protein] synthase I
MGNIYLSGFSVLSSQGDLISTVASIKNNQIRLSKKHIVTDIQSIDAPYFLLADQISEDTDAIYRSLKEVTSTVIENLVQRHGEDCLPSTALILGMAMVDLNLTHAIESYDVAEEGAVYASNKTSIDSYAARLASDFGLNDLTMTINTACTSSANAILEGVNLIKTGIVESVIVIGVEISSPMMCSGFSTMNLLTLSHQKPFQSDRDGMVLGEGIAAVVLSKRPSKHALLGGYSNCNSVSITGVLESGEEYIEVMQNALNLSGVQAENISAIKTHATSTPASDLSEINALSMFKNRPRLSALKPYIGHTIGACGVLELVLFLACVDEGFIPKFPSQENHDLCSGGLFLLNYFGFGGNNTSLIVKSDADEALYQ